MHRLILNLRAYYQYQNSMPTRSQAGLSFQAAYRGLLNSGGNSSRSAISSFMGVEELGGLLGPLDGENETDGDQDQTERYVFPVDLDSTCPHMVTE